MPEVQKPHSEFDIVRKGISEPHRANNRYEYDNALRALRRIEEQLEASRKDARRLRGLIDAGLGREQALQEQLEKLKKDYDDLRDHRVVLVNSSTTQNDESRSALFDLVEQNESLLRVVNTAIAYCSDLNNRGEASTDDLEAAIAALYPATKFHAFCKDGSLQPCEICVGSCGIEEAEEAAQSPASEPQP